MKGYVYKSHNKITDMYYIGCKLNEQFIPNYFGSGKYLLEAVKQFGKENFEVELLEWVENFDNIKILHDRESYWVNFYNAALSDKFYNISATGNSGNAFLGMRKEDKEAYAEKQRQIGRKAANGGKGMFGRNIPLTGSNNPMFGRKHSEASKKLNRKKHLGKKMSDSTRLKMKMSHNPNNKPPNQFGRKHINKDGIRKYVFKEELEYYLNNGWNLGDLKRNEKKSK